MLDWFRASAGIAKIAARRGVCSSIRSGVTFFTFHISMFNIFSLTLFQLRGLKEFVDAQTNFFMSAAAHAQQLQSLIQDTADISTSSSFPRRNSNANNVPVADILKVHSAPQNLCINPFRGSLACFVTFAILCQSSKAKSRRLCALIDHSVSSFTLLQL